MPDANDQGTFLLQLAISLRLAAQRLADSAARMQQAAERQRQQLDQLTLLRDRIIELLAACRRITDKEGAAQAPKPVLPPMPAPRPFAAAPQPPATQAPARLPASAFVEFSNWQEFEKFRRMAPISDQDLESCNLEELIRRLGGDTGLTGAKP